MHTVQIYLVLLYYHRGICTVGATINLIDIDIELGMLYYRVSMYVFPILVSSVPGQEFVTFCFSARNENARVDTQGFHVVVAR